MSPLFGLAESFDQILLAHPMTEVIPVPVRSRDDSQRPDRDSDRTELGAAATSKIELFGCRVPQGVEQHGEREDREQHRGAVGEIARRDLDEVVVDRTGEVTRKRAKHVHGRRRVERPQTQQRSGDGDRSRDPRGKPCPPRRPSDPHPGAGGERAADGRSQHHEGKAFARGALPDAK